MHILLTNDDGIEAEGLQSLAIHLRNQPEVSRITIVAPIDGRSCCGHSVNTYSAMHIQEIAPEQYAVDSWPADCVRVALKHLGLRPDWVLSGINHGGNLGVDILMSGTCSAAREAAWFNIPSMALSQYRSPQVQVPWSISAHRGWQIASQLIAKGSPGMGFWNINLPSLSEDIPMPPPVACQPDTSHHHFDLQPTADGLLYRSTYQDRPRLPGYDIDYCLRGYPTVSLSTSGFQL